MARIPLSSGFTLCPEGTHVFRICDVQYDETFGKMTVKLVNAQGIVHRERYSLLSQDGSMNEGAINAFSFFAKCALNDFTREDVDPEELVNHFIRAEVTHNTQASTKDPSKTMTFANLGNKEPAEYFDTTPVPAALSMGADNAKPVAQAAPAVAPATPAAPAAPAQTGSSLLDLLK